jgi:hypothetical protein
MFRKGRQKTGGRARGTPNHNTVRERRLISEAADRRIVHKTVTEAEAGNPGAQALYYRFLRPSRPRPETFVGPIDYVAPATVEEARARILELGARLARGEISIEAHDSLVGGLKAFLGDKAADQERRLADLEAKAIVAGDIGGGRS